MAGQAVRVTAVGQSEKGNSVSAKEAALAGRGAGELAAMISRGDVSAAEAVEAHIERIEEVNPALNAVVVERYEAARAEARQADERRLRGEPLGPLHGVPVTIKDAIDVEGTPSTFGLPSRVSILATEDDLFVARLREAGAIILGKTNVAQLLIAFESDNPVHGRTNNPWNLGRSPGGSSGGEAAIIAAGGSPLGLGTDIAGSVRNPAAFCGIASLKPTTGRLPDRGRHSIPPGQQAVRSQVGVMARTVSDVALGLEAANGGRDPAVEPPMPLGDNQAVDVSRLRVAFYADDGTFPVSPAARRAVTGAAEVLRGRGARVTEWSPPDAGHAMGVFFALISADGARGLKRTVGRDPLVPGVKSLVRRMSAPRPLVAVLEKTLGAIGQKSLAALLPYLGRHSADHYWRMVEARMDYERLFAEALDRDAGGPFDVVLCPAAGLAAFPHGAGGGPIGTMGAYTLLYNLIGYPAGVVPVTRVRPGEESDRPASRDLVERAAHEAESGSAGLPVGVQVVARPWREHVALAAMRAIEETVSAREDHPSAPPMQTSRRTDGVARERTF